MLAAVAAPVKLTALVTLIFACVQLTPGAPTIGEKYGEDPVFVLHNGRLHKANKESHSNNAHLRGSILRFLKNNRRAAHRKSPKEIHFV